MNTFFRNSACICFCLVMLIVPYSYAQTRIGNATSDIKKSGNIFTVSYDNADVSIEFCRDDIVRVRTSWDRSFEQNEPYMVSQYDWPNVKCAVQKTSDYFEISSSLLTLHLFTAPFSIQIFDKDGKLLSEGVGNEKNGESVKSVKKMMPDEHFFGFGERMDFLDRRGKRVMLNVGRGKLKPHIVGAYNILEANYSPVPFFMSTRGYGIFLHNSYETIWDMGNTKPSQYSFQADGGEMDYYFMYGPKFTNILDAYTAITGKSPMMNKFAFGLHVGTYSGGTWGHEEHTSTQYVINLVRKFRELGIPIDVLHLDSTWRIFGDTGGKGATTFEWRETFDDPKAMFDTLYQLHLNMVGLHIRPRFDNGNELNLLEQARKKGYVYPEDNNPGEFVNYFDQEAVDWWWENGVMKVASIGAKFLKTDEGSAFGGKANESEKMGPTGKEIKRLHNVFPVPYAKAPYEKFQEYNGVRGMNHTREGYAGIQRYPFIFAGDWPSEWQYFEPVMLAGINIGLSGVGYWSHCMGGFEHDADPELYIRWCQFGMFSPVAHLFGMDHPGYKEPWNYGDEALKIFKQYDEMRYQLIPYMYSNAWTMYQKGTPLMRALVMEYQHDPNTYDITDQYMFGASMMVCPVTTKEAQTRVVYLPEGKWYSHWDDKAYEGKQHYNIVSPLDQMPIFYKAGSIVPRQPVVQYVTNEPSDSLSLDVYAGADGDFALYDDDGHSLEYQKGMYAITEIAYHDSDKQLTIAASKGKYDLPERVYTIRVHHMEAPTDLLIKRNNKKVKVKNTGDDPLSVNKWQYDASTNILTIMLKKEQDDALEISVQ